MLNSFERQVSAHTVLTGRMLILAGVVQALEQLAIEEAQVALELNQKCQNRGCEQTEES